ncbi:MAG: hypothetical protein KJO32_12645, partial [Deltaproteobacteria bacterium]|nr:hypothetical protein [Deltaproteobacteria bacterium]
GKIWDCFRMCMHSPARIGSAIHSGISPNHLDILRHSRAVTCSQRSQAAPLVSSFVSYLAKHLELMTSSIAYLSSMISIQVHVSFIT